MAVNDNIRDMQLDHDAMLRMFENNLNREINEIYNRHGDSLRNLITNNQPTDRKLRQIEREIVRANQRVFRMLSSELRNYITQELDFRADMLHDNIGQIWNVRTPPRSQLRSLVVNDPIRDSRILSEHFSDIASGEYQRVQGEIRRGIRDGLTEAQIGRRIVNGSPTKITRLQARALARTALTTYASTVSDMMYQENSDVLDGYQYVATLDSRTTPICSSLDGRVFPTDQASTPRPPQHWNCRSTTIPVVKAFQDIPDVPQLRPVSRDGRTRARQQQQELNMTGQIAASVDYDQWLRGQPESVQLMHMRGSEERLRIWLEGNLSLRDIVNNRNQYIDLDTMRMLNAQSRRDRSPQSETGTRVAPERTVIDSIVTVSDFYESGNNSELDRQLKQYFVSEAFDGRIELSSYRGVSLREKAESKRRAYENDQNPDRLIWDPSIGDYVNPAYMPHSRDVYDSEVARVRNSRDLTDADKDYILNRLNPYFTNRVDLNAQTTILRHAYNVFSSARRNNTDFTGTNFKDHLDSFLANSVAQVGRPLQNNALRSIGDRNRVRTGEVYAGALGTVPIRRVIDEFPDRYNRSRSFRHDFNVALERNNVITRLYGQNARPITPEFLNRALLRALRGGELNVDRLALRLGTELSRVANPFAREAWGDVRDHRDLGLAILMQLEANETLAFNTRTVRTHLKDADGANQGGYIYNQEQFIEWRDPNIRGYLDDREYVRARWRISVPDGWNLRRGEREYRDARGRLTGVLARTRGLDSDDYNISGKTYDALQNQINQENVISDFSYFIDLISGNHRTSGRRTVSSGNVDDTIRGRFLELDGPNRVSIANYFRDLGQSFRSLIQLQASGRSGITGYLNAGSGEFIRPWIDGPESLPLTDVGVRSITESFGKLVDKTNINTVEARQRYFREERDNIWEIGRLVEQTIIGNEPNRYLRELQDNQAYIMLKNRIKDPEELVWYLKLSREVYRMQQHTVQGRRLPRGQGNNRWFFFDELPESAHSYSTPIKVEYDAAESGQQALNATFKNKVALRVLNVISQGANNRLRTRIAQRILDSSDFQNLPFSSLLDLNTLAKLGKDNVTTSGYLSSTGRRIVRLNNMIRDFLNMDSSTIAFTQSDRNRLNNMFTRAIKRAQSEGNTAAEMQLRDLQKSVRNSIRDGEPFYNDWSMVESYFDADARNAIMRLNMNNSRIVTPMQILGLSRLYVEFLGQELNGFETNGRFLRDVAERFIESTGRTSVPTRSYDGETTTHTFPSSNKHRLRRTLEDLSQVFTNVKTYDRDIVNIDKVRSATPPLFNFGIDSAIARALSSYGQTIYDGFYIHPSQADNLKRQALEEFRTILREDVVGEWLDLLRREGLPQEDYDEFRAELDEIIGDATPEDILDDVVNSYILD